MKPDHEHGWRARDSAFRPEVRRALPAIIAVRFLMNVAMRMGYTFLPAFARGSGLSVGAMSLTLSARELTSLTATVAGRASDRYGAIKLMIFGGVVASIGLLIATFGATGLVVGFIVLGFGRTAHQVAMNGWMGSVVAYERRGRVTGLIELTWGGASLVGLPLVGLAIRAWGWSAAPAGLGVLLLLFSLRLRSHESSGLDEIAGASRPPRMTRASVAAIVTNGGLAAAAQFLFLGHGLWLEDTFGLNPTSIGFAVVAVGSVEVLATLFSARLTDRLGKRTSIITGAVVMTGSMFGLAALGASPPLWLGLTILALAFLGFEFAIVSAIPLIAELDPNARAQMIGRATLFATVVRAAVNLVATSIYLAAGFGVLMTVAGVIGAGAIALATFSMVEPASGAGKERDSRSTP